jgi:alkanesulfonate monooxygenase SsuD/methylene tetrahydromethanopterin reductase-like flavin-dependent oxidoreductase (luciferase family)
MRFDLVTLPNYVAGMSPGFDHYYQELLEQIELAEELGFGCAWFTEHHFMPYGGMIPNPATMLMAAAARTSRIRLGCSVSVLPLRHPLHIAEEYAMVDALSGGRLEFGIGIGNTPREYELFGVAPDDSRARFDEAFAIILKAWANERFSHEGKFWRLEDVTIYPRPVQQPHPPIWIAGMSEGSLGRAGQLGYNIMTVAHPRPPETVTPGVAAWRRNLQDIGRDPGEHHCLIHLRGWVGADAAEARRVGQEAIARYDELSRRGRREARPDEFDWDGMLASGRNVYGDPDQCIAIMRRTQANFDFDIFGMQFSFGGIPHAEVMQAMRLFAREVMPAFA